MIQFIIVIIIITPAIIYTRDDRRRSKLFKYDIVIISESATFTIRNAFICFRMNNNYQLYIVVLIYDSAVHGDEQYVFYKLIYTRRDLEV